MSKLREIFNGNYKPPKNSSKGRCVRASQVFAEAKCAGINPQEFADKINAAFDEQEANESTNYSAKERQNILEMARQAGMDVSTSDGRKKALEGYNPHITNDEDSLLENEATTLAEKLDTTLEIARNILLKERKQKEAEELKAKKIDSLIRETMLAGGFKPKK